MIITITPNPSIDRAFTVSDLQVGQVNRADAVQVDAGGKGINISRALHSCGVPTVAVFPCGGSDGDLLSELLVGQGIKCVPAKIAGSTRSNITVNHLASSDTDGKVQGPVGDRLLTTKINAPGAALTSAEVSSLVENLVSCVKPNDTVVGAGSLPAGIPHEFYARVAHAVHTAGGRFVLDSSGAALAGALEHAEPGTIHVIKPNLEELQELAGSTLETVRDVVDAARPIVEAGVSEVLVSLGEHGMLLVSAATEVSVTWAGALPVAAVSTVGAGDVALAGYLEGGAESDTGERLRQAVAWGRAAALTPGTAIPDLPNATMEDVLIVAAPDWNCRIADLTRHYLA